MVLELPVLNFVVVCLAIIGCCSLPALIALWLAKSRLHWLFQSLFIVAVAYPWSLVSGYDLALIILVAGFSLLIGSWLVQLRQRRKLESDIPSTQQLVKDKPTFQFGLSDFAAVFALLGVMAALLGQASRDSIWAEDLKTNLLAVMQCLLIGAAVAIWSIALPVFRSLKFRFWLLWLAVLAATAVAAGWDSFTAKKLLLLKMIVLRDSGSWFLFDPTATIVQSILGWTVALTIHAVTVALILWLFNNRTSRNNEAKLASLSNVRFNWLGIGKKLVGGAFLVLFFSAIAYCFFLLLPPTRYVPRRDVVVGAPNYFPGLVEAGLALTDSAFQGDPPVLPGATLANKLDNNRSTFDKVEVALAADNCFFVDWNSSRFDFAAMASASELRTIARALSARSLQALSEGRHDDVVKDGQLCFTLADRIATDGTLVLGMVGTAIEGIGVEAMRSGIDGATENQLNALASQLDGILDRYPSQKAEFDDWVAADKFFMWNSSVTYWLDTLSFSLFGLTSAYERIRTMLVRRDTVRELLRTEIAIVLYRSKNGQVPETLDALVPEFIDRVPNDRYSTAGEQPFQYIVFEDGQRHKLYSLGKDRDDDGGETNGFPMSDDIDLQALYGNRLARNAKEVKEHEEQEAARLKEEEEWREEEEWGKGLEEMNGENFEEMNGENFEEMNGENFNGSD